MSAAVTGAIKSGWLRKVAWWMFCCGAQVPGWAASVTQWPEVPAPPRSHVQWVAKDLWLNGVPTRVQRFESSQASAAVLAHYRAHWCCGDAGATRENEQGGWHIISTLHGPFQLVVQVKPNASGGGSEGLISQVNLKELKTPYVPVDWPTRSPLKLRQVMESVDGPVRSHYLVATSDLSADRVRDTMAKTWDQAGWRLQQEVQQAAGYLATYRREGQTLEMAISPNDSRLFGQRAGRVNVVVNFVQSFQERKR